MYIITPYTENRYKLYLETPGVAGMCNSVYICGIANYSLSLLLEFISSRNPTDNVFSTTIVRYYIEYLPVLVAVDSWSELREEVENLVMLEAL